MSVWNRFEQIWFGTESICVFVLFMNEEETILLIRILYIAVCSLLDSLSKIVIDTRTKRKQTHTQINALKVIDNVLTYQPMSIKSA